MCNGLLTPDDILWINENLKEEDPLQVLLKTKGKPCEEDVLAYIKRYDKKAYIVEGYDSGKDIVAPTINKTFEVKNCQDAVSHVPIEIQCRYKDTDHPAGLAVTTATYWVFFCWNKFFMIATEKLKELVKDLPEKNYPQVISVTTLKILPIELLEKHARHSWEVKS